MSYKHEDLLLSRIKYADIIFEEDLLRVSTEVSNYSLNAARWRNYSS